MREGSLVLTQCSKNRPHDLFRALEHKFNEVLQTSKAKKASLTQYLTQLREPPTKVNWLWSVVPKSKITGVFHQKSLLLGRKVMCLDFMEGTGKRFFAYG